MKSLTILLLSVMLVISSSISEQTNQIKQLSQKIFTAQKDQQYMTNMFLKYNEVIVKSRVYFIKNRKQTTIVSQQTELILQHDYWQMYKKKLSPMLRFNLTAEVMSAIKENVTFLQTTVYVIAKQMRHQIDKQSIPLMKNFSHIGREGIDNWMIADQELLQMLPEEQLVLTHEDLYFFDIDWQLPFSTKGKKMQGFGVYKDTDKSYYFPKPLSKDINIKLKQNYTPLSKLAQGEIFKMRTNIKLAGLLYPLFIYAKQRQQQFPESPLYQYQGFNQEIIDRSMSIFWPYLYRFLKNVVLEGSILNWAIFLWSGFAVLSSVSVAVLSFFFQYRIFKYAQQHRGMSLYGLILILVMNVVIIVTGLISKTHDSISVALLMVLFTWWKIRKMASIQFSPELPFVNINGSQWYKTYQKKDWTVFSITLPFILTFIVLVTLYPLIFQNYVNQAVAFQLDETTNYLLQRLILAIDQYLVAFALIIQAILNYQLKTCNSLTWKFIITLMIYYSVDNSLILVTPSTVDLFFWLKEDILLWILIFQKVTYGNSLQHMKIPPKKDQDNENKVLQKQTEQEQQQQQLKDNQYKSQDQMLSDIKKEVSQEQVAKVQDQKQKKQ